jgi:hypothetical protein
MGMITIAEVLERVNDFERMLAEFYAKLSQETTKEGVRLLSDYMSRHRQRTHIALLELPIDEAEEITRICHTSLRYEPQGLGKSCFEGIELGPDATAAEVLDVAIEFDECLIRFYKQVLQQPVHQHIKELFESLARKELSDEIELKKIKATNYF